MIYLYLFGTCFHFIYVFMIIGKYKAVLWTKKRFKGNGASTYAYYSQGAQGNNGNKIMRVFRDKISEWHG